jgi:hypothetical protein
MNRSIRHGGENEMNNNANLQEAYMNQLYNQLSLIQLEINARKELLNFGNERSDDDERQDDTWNPMQEVHFSDNGSDGAMDEGTDSRDDHDSGLPCKYQNKMKHCEHLKNKIPTDLPLGQRGLSILVTTSCLLKRWPMQNC